MDKRIRIIVFLLLVVIAGYFRETFFVRIKWQMLAASGETDAPPHHWLFSFLEHFTFTQLSTLRYISTVLFIFIFWLLALLMNNWFFHQPANKRLIHLIFISVFGLGVLIFGLGKIIPNQMAFYEASRWVIGLVETPLILALLYPVLLIQARSQSIKER